MKASRRGPRPARRLPPGPFRVPISTIDWLVSRETPAARYVALRDLLGRPAKDLELRKAKQALPRDPFVRDVVALLHDRLHPARVELEKRYDGGFWLVHFLVEIGADASLPALRRAADVLFAHWEKTFVAIDRASDPPLDPRLFATVLRTLALLGHADDPRVLAGAEHLARLAPRGTTDTAKLLLLFASLPVNRRTQPMERAIAFLVARAEDSDLPVLSGAAGSAPAEELGFPTGESVDLLEILHALALLGIPRKPSLESGLSHLAARADHRGRWKLERALKRMPVALERPGELSRWITLRALAVMQHFLGLAIEGAKAVPRSPAR